MGKSPENRQPLKDKFQTVPVPVYEPMRYFTKKHCTGKRRIGANREGHRVPRRMGKL